MREPAGGIEPETGPGGGGDSAINKIDSFRDRAGPVRIGKADAPWRAIGPCADGSYLAHVDERRR